MGENRFIVSPILNDQGFLKIDNSVENFQVKSCDEVESIGTFVYRKFGFV